LERVPIFLFLFFILFLFLEVLVFLLVLVLDLLPMEALHTSAFQMPASEV
jgi:hypothetical protein